MTTVWWPVSSRFCYLVRNSGLNREKNILRAANVLQIWSWTDFSICDSTLFIWYAWVVLPFCMLRTSGFTEFSVVLVKLPKFFDLILTFWIVYFLLNADWSSCRRGERCTLVNQRSHRKSSFSVRWCRLQLRKTWKNITFAMSTIKLLLISLVPLIKHGQKSKNFFSLSQREVW